MKIDGSMERKVIGWLIVIAFIGALIAILTYSPRVRAENKTPLDVLNEATADLLRLPVISINFKMMSTHEMHEDGCVNPSNCPTYASVHPPKAPYIIVNSDMDIADLNVQGQLVHVIAMYYLEAAGVYSPDMECKQAMQIEAQAQVIQAGYMDLAIQRAVAAGEYVPPFEKFQVITWCAAPPVKGEF